MEWGEEVWAARLDPEKDFGKVLYSAVLDALVEAEVGFDAERFVLKLYAQQSACLTLPGHGGSRFF